jgi:PilZ domain
LRAFTEKRRSQRHRTLKGGKIYFHKSWAGIDCVVRDLSEGGAGIIVESEAGIPERFNLVISSTSLNRPCRLAWRLQNRIGVSFQ